ncbi:MAG: hypothetical protein ABL907_09145 [Hyphomicrobium sp.]
MSVQQLVFDSEMIMSNLEATRGTIATVPQDHTSLLQHIRIDYGPPDVLGRFFLKALAAAELRGLRLEVGTFNDLLIANQDNRDNWLPLLTIFDHRKSAVTPETAFCILGRDHAGRVVAAHAARLFDWSRTSFHEEAESLRLFYADPETMRLPGERCIVTAPTARTLTGQVVYSGAAWYHPNYRGRQLSAIFPKIAKALAFARWSPDFVCSVMQASIHARGFATRFDYPVVDWDVQMIDGPLGGAMRVALVWMEGLHIINSTKSFLSDSAIERDSTTARQRRA